MPCLEYESTFLCIYVRFSYVYMYSSMNHWKCNVGYLFSNLTKYVMHSIAVWNRHQKASKASKRAKVSTLYTKIHDARRM